MSDQVKYKEENYGLDLDQEGSFVTGSTRFDHSSGYEQDIFFVHKSKVKFYMAIGEDELDLNRDWAFEYARLFPATRRKKKVDVNCPPPKEQPK
jgi:hypothetical protein